MAESFARRAGASLLDKPGEELTVLFDAKGVSLIGYGLSYQGDFEGMLHRVTADLRMKCWCAQLKQRRQM